jgi:t-SNARE complex subunit (syntaxin)
MHEVNQMTRDMAVEVDSADSKLEQIGQNARATKENTKKALVDVAKGAEYQGKSYKKM